MQRHIQRVYRDINQGSPCEKSSWQRVQKQQQRKQTPVSPRKIFFSYFYSGVWLYVMRDQKQTSACSMGLQRWHCASARPFQRDWLFGAGGPRAASAAFVLPYETNLTVTSQCRGMHCCCGVSSAMSGTIPIGQPVTSLVSQNLKFSQLSAWTSLFFILISLPGCLHGVSIVIHILLHWNAPSTLLWGPLFPEVAIWPHVFGVSVSSLLI